MGIERSYRILLAGHDAKAAQGVVFVLCGLLCSGTFLGVWIPTFILISKRFNMVTSILDKLLNSQFGKSFIFWVFLALGGAVVVLGFAYNQQEKELKRLNEQLIMNEKQHSEEREKAIREQILIYQSMLQRLEAVQNKRKQ